MVEIPELKDLQTRKQVLLAKSELHRCTLALTCERVKEQTAWIDRTAGFARTSWPVLVVLAPLAGYLLVKKRAFVMRAWSRAWLGWKLYRSAWPLVQSFLAARPQPAE